MSGKRRGVALLATARDAEEAAAWQDRLRESGVSSIVRGHRPEGAEERRPLFSGADLYVPGALLRQAREALSDVISPEQLPPDEPAFPWAWVAAVPVAIGVVVVVAVVVLLA